MENLNLLFYKTVYDKLGQNDFEQDVSKKAKRLVDSKFYEWNYQPVTTYTKNIENDENSENEDTVKYIDIANQKFLMKISYPGLIVGIGYDHGIDIDYDIKVGFF